MIRWQLRWLASAALLLGACSGSSEPRGNDDALQDDAPGAVEINRNGPTVTVRGRLPTTAATEEGARQLIERYPAVFGLGSDDAVEASGRIDGGDSTFVVRLRRTHRGTPVFAADLRVGFAADGGAVFVQAPAAGLLDVSVEAAVSAADARAAVLAGAAAWGPSAEVESEALGVFVPELYGARGSPMLVYGFELGFANASGHVAFVDAATGGVVLEYAEREELARTVYQWVGDKDWIPEITAPVLVSEGDPPPGTGATAIELEAYAVYSHLGALDAYLFARFGWDGWNGAGGPFQAFVGNPESNAFWFGPYAALGVGYSTVDIVTHEFGHGVVDAAVTRPFGSAARGFVSCGESLEEWLLDAPVACGEANALDEWTGDVLAAFLSFETGVGDWRVDAEAELVRDMSQSAANRTIINYSEVAANPKAAHRNSAIPSLAIYLLADPSATHPLGSGAPPFRSIGVAKVEQIFFRALRLYLRSTATFDDARYALLRACEDLYEAGRAGIVLRDCGAVLNAWAAVGVGEPDEDEDTWHDGVDNCKGTFNPDQADDNGDGIGDACAPSADGGTDLPLEGYVPCPAEFPSAVAGPWPLTDQWSNTIYDPVYDAYSYMCRYGKPASLTTSDFYADNASFNVTWYAYPSPGRLGCGSPPLVGREGEDTISATHYAWISHNGYPLMGNLGPELEVEFRAFVDELFVIVAEGGDGQMVPPAAACE